VPAWTAPAPDDAAMLKLATGSGCMICHHIEPGTTGPDGLGPIGATWR
jgi:cytochrome c